MQRATFGEKRVNPVFPGLQVLLVRLGHRVSQGLQVLQARRESLDLLVLRVIRVILVNQDLRASLDLQVRKDRRARQVQKDRRDLRENQVPRVTRVSLGLQVLKVHKDLQAQRDHRDHQVRKDRKARLGRRDLRDPRVKRVILASVDHVDQEVPRVLLPRALPRPRRLKSNRLAF